ncbi:RNA polymerase sigma factor [Kitasatospora sp. NPDC089913]|uniref:RNA polymerase sigma factor n=1 Tax=Kitasatospora sp. NPDC089913 TaxID=3364080 RepID=UPI00380366E6
MYVEHYPAVHRYVLRRVPPADVQDVTAEVFTTAWRRFGEVPRGAVLPWLYGVARNTVANQYRGADRDAVLAAAVGAVAAGAVRDVGEEFTVRDTVRRAWAALSAGDRELLALIGWEGLAVRDAARVLGCSSAACSVRLMRARGRLRKALQESERTGGAGSSRRNEQRLGAAR